MPRILIVDDEEEVCEDLKTFLTAKEHEVEVAYNAEEGLAKLKAFRPHLVLLDIREGAADYVTKPMDLNYLSTSIRVNYIQGVG